MEQEVRFCTTSDGVRIAYATVGEGPPAIYTAGWPTHLELEWASPQSRSFIETLAAGLTLIRYDMRGTGISDRDVSDFSLDALARDLEAVADQLAVAQFGLLTLGALGSPVAITYAVRHPDRVSHLFLYSAFVHGSKITSPERQQALLEYAGTFGFPLSQFTDEPSGDGSYIRDAQRRQEAAAAPATQAALLKTIYSSDVSGLLDRLRVPLEIMHGRGDRAVPFAQGRELAARLPNAKFVPFEGNSGAPWIQRHVLVPEVHRFFGVESALSEERPPTGLVTILFADVANSTGLTERLGDAAFRERARKLDAALRTAITSAGGTPVEGRLLGDGLMAVFTSAHEAIEAALRCTAVGAESELRLRIGAHAGDVLREGNNVFGGAVNIASRVADAASPGEVLVSRTVRDLARTSAGASFEDRGERELKGVSEPVRVFAVRGGET